MSGNKCSVRVTSRVRVTSGTTAVLGANIKLGLRQMRPSCQHEQSARQQDRSNQRNSSTRFDRCVLCGHHSRSDPYRTFWHVLHKTPSYPSTSGFQGRVCLHCWHRFTQMLTKHLLPHQHYQRRRRTLYSGSPSVSQVSRCALSKVGPGLHAAARPSSAPSLPVPTHKLCVHAHDTPSKASASSGRLCAL